ncbi:MULTISPECIES: AraC family transcriptional regulator [Bacillus cereus group]|uniref:Transcriptional regulator, AraC family n=1 Tax=Bacillus thuringiensis TaxID=1428 RepID=A0A1C4E5I4_BACTU|nr:MULTISPECIES: AraC family transcriptional regulator [Bacillus cereus group]MED3025704.1 AraC family transcriptional regulator [Bacillus wiedmannii]OTY00911.1 AraC family transcriptional regulator [Bacillus thuringiensis serovar wratislaviensis]OUB59169.1 AraC family transcriptional regulator [Bacillus thuringiensis serovar sylvestriensis]SCC38917.1 Transcriptional regulator, AraC family [Bacillus thuringiensis]
MGKSNYSVDTDCVCNLLYQTFEIPVRFLDKSKNILYEWISNDIQNPFYSSKEEQLNELYWDDDPINFPIIRTNNYLENFILIHIVNKKSIEGTFIIGPTIYSEPLEETINKIINDFHVITTQQEVINYYHSIPTIKRLPLIHISILLYYMIYFEKIEVSTVVKRNISLKNTTCEVKKSDLFISVRHQNNHECADISLEIQIFEAIKSGNKEKLLKYVELFPNEKIGVLCVTNELRNRKNQGIICIALATRYAIDGGLPSDIAFSLSDLYIQNLEKLNDVTSVVKLIIDAFCVFADYVKKNGDQKLSKAIMDCKNYIAKNIYQEISLKQLAHVTNKNPMYLSTLFKKEVGVSLSEYMQREKVEEAKKLLTLTNYSLLDISTFLNFNSQSYFTKIFKKHTEITPKQYRNQNTIY